MMDESKDRDAIDGAVRVAHLVMNSIPVLYPKLIITLYNFDFTSFRIIIALNV